MAKYIIELDDANYCDKDAIMDAIVNAVPYNPSTDAISRSGIKSTVVDLAFNPNDMGDEQVCAFNGALQMVCDAIDAAPAVNLEKHSFIEGYKEGCEEGKRCYERPKGEWKLYGMIYYCSECGHDCGESGDNFCGNCGADMRGTDPVINAIQENNTKYDERPNIDFDGMSYDLGGDKE